MITGIRRCGKSYLLFTIFKRLYFQVTVFDISGDNQRYAMELADYQVGDVLKSDMAKFVGKMICSDQGRLTLTYNNYSYIMYTLKERRLCYEEHCIK